MQATGKIIAIAASLRVVPERPLRRKAAKRDGLSQDLTRRSSATLSLYD
jgi:hypothetical protein